VLSVNVFSLSPPDIAQAGPVCNNSLPFKLIANPTGGIYSGNGVNGVTPEGLFNPAVAQIGSNILSYSIQVGPCIAYAQTTIQVQAFVSADMAKQPEAMYCKTADPFNLNSLVQNVGGTWSGPSVAGTMFYPKNANIGNNVLVYQTTSAPVASLCADSKTIQIKIKDLPKVTVKSNVLKGCAPMEVNFSTAENLAGTSYWTISDGSGKQNGSSITYTFTKSGEYDVIYNYNDDDAVGCSTQVTLKDKIQVYPMPHAAFSTYPEEITVSDPEILVTNLSTPLSDNRYWWVVEGVNFYDDVNPRIHFPQAGNYRIKLKATNIFGCFSEASKMVVVKNEFNVFIPNSFTPNFDGINDTFVPVFSPYGLSSETYLMEIFDRWGHLLFTSKDHHKGWDGTYNNKGDEILKEDSYTYRIRYKDLEGNAYSKMGTVVLLK
jgi:gliding motility-associated-like protein